MSFDYWCKTNKLHHKDIIFPTLLGNNLCAVPETAPLNVLETFCFWEELKERVQLKRTISEDC